jgi:hypothetical protein
LLTLAAAWGLPQAASAFSLEQGVVGNLSKQCGELGNCTWCDFVGLMVVLQKTILSLFGGLALIMLVWGGQGIISAAGNQEKIGHAKGIITATLFGVVIVLAGYFLVNVIVGILITPPGQPLNTKLFGSSWWEAQCSVNSAHPDFCRSQGDGVACGYGDTDRVCWNSQCTESCLYFTAQNPALYLGCKATCGTGEVAAAGGCPTVTDVCCIKQ